MFARDVPSCYRMFPLIVQGINPIRIFEIEEEIIRYHNKFLIKVIGHKMNHASSGVVGQGSLGDSCTRSLAATANQLLGVTLGKILDK